MDNSPAQLDGRSDTHRPVVLVSSSGTKVIHEAAGSEAIYLSCFRDYSFLSTYLAGRHDKVAIIGAGSLGEFREEDQACCAWIGAELMSQGYQAKNTETEVVVDRWRDQPPKHASAAGALLSSSVRTGSKTWSLYSAISTTCTLSSPSGTEK